MASVLVSIFFCQASAVSWDTDYLHWFDRYRIRNPAKPIMLFDSIQPDKLQPSPPRLPPQGTGRPSTHRGFPLWVTIVSVLGNTGHNLDWQHWQSWFVQLLAEGADDLNHLVAYHYDDFDGDDDEKEKGAVASDLYRVVALLDQNLWWWSSERESTHRVLGRVGVVTMHRVVPGPEHKPHLRAKTLKMFWTRSGKVWL